MPTPIEPPLIDEPKIRDDYRSPVNAFVMTRFQRTSHFLKSEQPVRLQFRSSS